MTTARLAWALALCSLSAACASPDGEPRPAGPRAGHVEASQVITIRKQTQAEVGDSLRIAAAAFWEAEWTEADGRRRTGPTAGLWIYRKGKPHEDHGVRAHPGLVLSVDGWRIQVVSIDAQAVTIAAHQPRG